MFRCWSERNILLSLPGERGQKKKEQLDLFRKLQFLGATEVKSPTYSREKPLNFLHKKYL